MDLQELRRFPDVDGPSLSASDAADRLILDEAGPWLAEAPAGTVSVIDDAYGALTLGAEAVDVRVHQDLVTGSRALDSNADRLGGPRYRAHDLTPDLVDGARVVMMRLPRALDRLAEVSALVAAYAAPDVVVVAGGRIKHMSTQMNDVLLESFERVDISHARQKSRVLLARGPRREVVADRLAAWPRVQTHEGLTVAAHGGVFAGTRIDIGTRFLLDVLDEAVPDASTAVDLACGSGVVASAFALARPGVTVTASVRSADAVRS
ncbi:methyltransferase, partial [Gordonia sp. (in: high G+C Gram-positive bacteria)]|uniref:methyltransferase n=1 Tax=Gordonia sp. (in: high G+C Gram-positive bacteria) TaxID=84139 RepID=UPI003F972126